MRSYCTYIICFIFGLIPFSLFAQQILPSQYGGSTPVNYVRTWDAIKPDSNVNNFTVASSTQMARMTTQYFDGLGRPVQIVVRNGSLETSTGTFADMVSTILYDEFGREQYKYLPSPANNTGGNTSITDGLFKLNPFQQQESFYNSYLSSQTGEVSNSRNWAYSKTNFEASPLNRVMEAYAPGNSWVGSESATNATDRHPVKMSYWVNTATDSVRVWNVNDVSNSFGTYHTTSAYGAGELYKNVTEDERGKQVIEFKDKEGKVILKKVQLTAAKETDGTGSGHAGWICTYYIYDDLNNLRAVIQPEGVKLLDGANWANCNPVSNTTLLAEQTFRYEYDQRNRMIMKKVPGAGEVYMVYDPWDRLMLTQDANLRANHKYLLTKYDALNRPVLTGLYTFWGTVEEARGIARDFAPWRFEERESGGNGSGYTSRCWPSIEYEILTVTYYDDYSWYGNPFSTSYNNAYDVYFMSSSDFPYPQANVQTQQTKGMVTGSKVKVLGSSNTFLYTTVFYDSKGRPIQTLSKNTTDGTDIVTTQYGWAGQPVTIVTKTESLGTPFHVSEIATYHHYDALGRLAKITKTMNHNNNGSWMNKPEQEIVKNEYDKLGQLKKKKLAPTYNSGTGLETLTYDYNIRGWMLGMNRSFLETPNNTNNWFGFELGYDKTSSKGYYGYYNVGQFNGNITGTLWKSKGDLVARKYDFSYDAANRLLTADFNQQSGTNWTKAEVDFSIGGDPTNGGTMKYDDNGNIKEMWQKGLLLTSSDWIDKLSYTYYTGTNKLQAVSDAMTTDNKLGDFTDKNTTSVDYGYDLNGNLITDLNKGLNGVSGTNVNASGGQGAIRYNYLNLPREIVVSGKGMIYYTYDATGNKLQKQVVEDATTANNNTQTITTTFYIGGFVYESKTVNGTPVYSNKLQFGGHEEGRIRTLYTNNSAPHTPTGFAYDYMLKDHLGNVRMVLTDELQTNIYPVAALEDATVSCENNFHAINTSKVVNKSTIFDPGNVLGYANNNGFAAGPCGSGSGTSNKMYRLFATGAGADTGLSMTLKVMSGDVINIWGKSYYNDANTGGTNYSTTATQLIAGFLGGGMGGATASGHGATTSLLGNNTPTVNGLNSFITDPARGSGTLPKAYVNWVLFDEQFKFVTGGFSRVDQSTNTLKDHHGQLTDLTMSKNGYLYIYVSNESPVAVFFDNLQVAHTRGPVLEETQYYPFGLSMSGISSNSASFGNPQNKKGYNGNEIQNEEFSDGNGLELYDFNARTYDQQIGRFIQIDPLVEFGSQEPLTPYQFSYNNPVRFSDPDGRCPCLLPILYAIGEAIVAAASTEAVAGVVIVGGAAVVSQNLNAKSGTSVKNNSFAWDPSYVDTWRRSMESSEKKKPQGSNNAKTKESAEVGQEAHRQIQKELKKEGAEIEVPMELEGGVNVRKDAVRPDGTVVIIKPDTKTGRRSASKREDLMKSNGHKTEKIFYDPFSQQFRRGSPTYIGPKNR